MAVHKYKFPDGGSLTDIVFRDKLLVSFRNRKLIYVKRVYKRRVS